MDGPDTLRGRLQRDRATTIACCCLALGLIFPTVGLGTIFVDGPQIEARGNPLYWALMLPSAMWVWAIMDYKPRALRSIRPGLFALPFLAGAVLAFAAYRDLSMTQYWVMLGLTCAATLAGGIAYNRSLLAREGPGD